MLLLVTVLDASVVIVSKPPFTRFLANFWTDKTCTGPPFLYTGPAEPCKLERFSYDLWKMVSVSVRYLFYQPMDEKIKTWPLRFPAKENPNTEKALFDWAIVLQYDVKVKYRLISRKFLGKTFFHPNVRLTNQKPARVCIRSINPSNRSISVHLLFLFCSRVFFSGSYENRSIEWQTVLQSVTEFAQFRVNGLQR